MTLAFESPVSVTSEAPAPYEGILIVLLVYKKKANVAAGLWFVVMLMLVASVLLTAGDQSNLTTAATRILFALNIATFWFAFWAYAKAKGYSGFVGLVLPLFSILGLIILHSLRDRHPDASD